MNLLSGCLQYTCAHTRLRSSSQSCITVPCPPEGGVPVSLPSSLPTAELNEEQQQLLAVSMKKGFLDQTDRAGEASESHRMGVRGRITGVKFSLTTRGDTGAHLAPLPHSQMSTLAQRAGGTSPGPHCKLPAEPSTEFRSSDS